MDLTAESLSPAQQIAVTAPLESRLVLAGPGTGKTRTLVYRVAHLISHFGLAPENILAVTYTNKATEEMRARLRTMLPDAAAHLSVGTFHAFCIRLLREHHAAVGLPKHFAVTDEKGQRAVLRRVRPNLAEFEERRMLSALSKHMLSEGGDGEPLPESLVETFDAYRTALRRNALIDFDDILLLAERLLLDSPAALDAVRMRFKAVLVDEFQDTDAVQYRILKLICLGPDVRHDANIPVFAVADDDQSIFAWRGADPRNVSRFTEDFLTVDPEEGIIKLEENYRCSGSIVSQANRLLSRTPRLFDKTPTAANAKGEPVRLDIFNTAADEAKGIASAIRTANAAGIPFSEMAVLYRQHSIGAEFERTLLHLGIPCQVVRGATLFDAPRVRRLLLLMRALANPNDDPSFAEFLAATCDEPTRLRVETAARAKNTTLRAGLSARLRANDSDHAERRQLSRVAGALSTAKTLLESMPSGSLTEWVRNLDTYLAEQQPAVSGQPSVPELNDPLGIAPVEMAARWFERLAVRGGTLVLAAGEPSVERAAVALLENMLGATGFAIRGERSLDGEPTAEPLVLLALDSAGEARATEGRKFSAVLAMPDFALGTPGRSGARREVPPECVPAGERGPRPSAFATLWKIAQGFLGLRLAPFLPNYVAVDTETTDLDTERNDVVEVAAVRVRDGQPTDTFSSLVKPVVPISAGSISTHHITAAMVMAQPSFADIAGEFRDFLGDDVVVAHNGLGFDFPILMRRFRECGRKLDNPLFDTLPFARRMYPDAQKASLGALAAKFGIDAGAAHRALDDTKALAAIFEAIKADYTIQQRTRLGTEHLGCLALAMLLEMSEAEAEQSPLFRYGRETWGDEASERFREVLFLEEDAATDAAGVATRITRTWQAAQAAAAEHPERQRANEAFTRFLDVLNRFDVLPLAEGMREALDFTRLFQMQDAWRARDAVTLMTIHAAKGLEFSRVWLPALEQGILPSGKSTRPNDPIRVRKVDEERRLLYVGMTRAMTHLNLSWARHRDGNRTMPSEFLVTLALEPADHTELSGTD